MGSEQYMPGIDRTFPPSPPVSLPVVTFNDRLTFHFNGEEIAVYHVERAHTDGDAIVHFRDSNVLHMGDNFFSGMYPLVDRSSGGSVLGMIAAVQFALEFCDGETRVIPGHGEPGNCADLETFGQMLADTTDRVRELMTQGKTLAEAIAARPSAAWDEELGGGFIKPDRFVEFIYKSLLDEEA
jgi:glyoxylase-like metal-dependent hydrolase (beta-lactamase superfamily II)